MNQRASTVVAAVVTGFVLVTIGMVIGSGREPDPQTSSVPAPAEPQASVATAQPVEPTYVTVDYPEPTVVRERRHHDDDDDDDDDDD